MTDGLIRRLFLAEPVRSKVDWEHEPCSSTASKYARNGQEPRGKEDRQLTRAAIVGRIPQWTTTSPK